MEHLNLQLTCTVTVMAGYLGTYSAYVEPCGLPWSLGMSSTSGVSLVACRLPLRR
jgi:hypothetical protein